MHRIRGTTTVNNRFSSNILFFYFGFNSFRQSSTFIIVKNSLSVFTYTHIENICHSMRNGFTVHQNYVAADQERNPLFLSVVTSEVSDQSVPHYRVILWRKTVSIRLYLYNDYCNLSDFSIRNKRGFD